MRNEDYLNSLVSHETMIIARKSNKYFETHVLDDFAVDILIMLRI